MIKGGKGGAKTNQNGLPFEERTSIFRAFEKIGYYSTELTRKADRGIYEVKDEKHNVVGYCGQKHALYRYTINPDINFLDRVSKLSKKLWPDNFFINERTKTIFIVEQKYQEVSGSVDEKIQTAPFKLYQYKKMFSEMYNVQFIYVLNDWFKKPQYNDVLHWLSNQGIHYFFNRIPLEYMFEEYKIN